ncbi:MAG: preprotein translocase subunit YajC [Gemmatimonadales bacterium]
MSPILPLFAQTAATPAAGSSGIAQIVLQLVLLGAIFYFLLIRPGQKQRKQQENSLFNLRKGDEIVTVGGVVGEILHIKETLKDGAPAKTLEDRITIKSGDTKLVIHRGRVHQVIKPSGSDATTA